MDTLPDAVSFLLEIFVHRQQIPFDVIKTYRPHLVDSSTRRPTKEFASATQRGYWGHENAWRYFLHGGGCLVIHTVTGEVINWDAPDLQRFDPYWFVDWLAWFVRQNVFFRPTAENDAVKIILVAVFGLNFEGFRYVIFDLLESLVQDGRLISFPDHTNRYKLII